MKAITLWQPWASLLITDIKKYETRSWKTSYRGLIAIHSAKKPLKVIAKGLPVDLKRAINRICKNAPPYLMHYELGCILGTAELVECHLIDEKFIKGLPEDERLVGDFTIGRYAWEFKDKQILPLAIEVRGGQQIWNWEGKP